MVVGDSVQFGAVTGYYNWYDIIGEPAYMRYDARKSSRSTSESGQRNSRIVGAAFRTLRLTGRRQLQYGEKLDHVAYRGLTYLNDRQQVVSQVVRSTRRIRFANAMVATALRKCESMS